MGWTGGRFRGSLGLSPAHRLVVVGATEVSGACVRL
jgi:hypothetical protein